MSEALLPIVSWSLVLMGALAALAWVVRRGSGAARWAVGLAIVTCAAFAVMAVRAPEHFERWMQEDGPVEWTTFFAFLFAAGLQLFFAVRSLRGERSHSAVERRFERDVVGAVASVCIALFCIFVAGEEISWGQRLLGLQPPEALLEHNFQQELNLHNLLKKKSLGPIRLESRFLVAWLAIVYGVLLPWGMQVWRKMPRAKLLQALQHLLRSAAPALWLTPFFAAVAVTMLDYRLTLSGEAAECVLGLLFLSDALKHSPAVRMPLGWALAFVIGVSTPPVVERWLFSQDHERTEQTRRELVELGAFIRKTSTGRFQLKGKVHKRVFTASKEGYLDVGADSVLPFQPEARGRFFLDPWNNPYWLETRSGRDTVLLYSFGANRRRDSNLDGDTSANAAAGDDVMLEVPFDAR